VHKLAWRDQELLDAHLGLLVAGTLGDPVIAGDLGFAAELAIGSQLAALVSHLVRFPSCAASRGGRYRALEGLRMSRLHSVYPY
jgi:hypothetical protein